MHDICYFLLPQLATTAWREQITAIRTPPAHPCRAPRSNARVKKKGITLVMGHTALVRVIVVCGFSISLPAVVIHDALSMFFQLMYFPFKVLW